MVDTQPPITCRIYDNPNTMQRELWLDGELFAVFLADNLLTSNLRGTPGFEPWGTYPAPNEATH